MKQTARRVLWMAYIVILSVCSTARQYSHIIYVDPERGNNSAACLNTPSPTHQCRNISYAFQYRNNYTQYSLQPGTHYLNSTASDNPFTDLTDIAITGNGSNAYVVCFTTNSGLAFVNVHNISLENVSFSNCSSLQNSTSIESVVYTNLTLSKVQVAVYFSHCESIGMQDVHVEHSYNATGIIMYNTIGVNNFTDCIFSNNKNLSPKLVGGGGGGVYIEFSYCLPGNLNCKNGSKESYTDHNKDSTYEFNNCSFSNNLATNRNPEYGENTFILPYRQIHEAFGRGGGLSVFFKANSTRNRVSLNSCTFSDNQALWGAGMFIEFQDTATGNNVSIIDTVFDSNSLLKSVNTSGGGMRIGHYIFRDGVSTKGNSISIERCNFTNNSAISGGALSFSPSGQKTMGELANVTLTSCNFDSNSARLGLAIHIRRFALIEGSVPCVKIVNISLTSNKLYSINYTEAYEVGGGAFYMSGVWVDFLGYADFLVNDGSALMIIRAEASFQNCSGIFIANNGLKGGAILLLGASSITVNESTEMYFLDNTAKYDGGAINKQYDDRDNMPQDPNCFIRHANPFLSPDEWETKFEFYNNSDRKGEIAIHATSLKPCVWAGGKTIGNVNVFCWKNWFYEQKQTTNEICNKHISSYAGHINYNYSIEEFPGIEIKLPITVLDDLYHSREIDFHAYSLDNQTALVDKAFEYVADNTLRFTGKVGESFLLELDSTGERVWHLEVNVTIKDCPPGFVATGHSNMTTCSCDGDTTVSYSGEVLCDQSYDDEYVASLSGSHWMGQLGNRTLVGTCPPQYCFINATQKNNRLPQSFSELDQHICGSQKRTGILCGRCQDDYGPAINSRSKQFTCVPCKNVNVVARVTYYILLEYVPMFVLFLALIVFNIKLTTGPANAFILYSQVISSTFDLSADGQIPLELSVSHSDSLLLAYQFPYGIFNLKFFKQFATLFCLSDKFNTLDVLVLDYVVGVFPLTMILLIILYIKIRGCCRGRCNVIPSSCDRLKQLLPRIGDSIIPAFASFLLLAYSKFNLTSSYIISHRSLIDASGDFHNTRVYYAGQYSSDDMEYILRYNIPANIMFVLFGVLPPLLLLQYPLKWVEMAVSKIPFLKKRYPFTKVHIFLDAFQGAFKHKMRFFTGLYFIFRLIIDLSYTLSNNWVEHYVIQEIVCIVFIILLALCRPYKPEYNILNFIDIAMFSNLAIITALGLYLYAVQHINPHQNPPLPAFVLQYTLVLLPLVCMMIYLTWYFILPQLILFCRKLFNTGDRDRELTNSSVFLGSRNSAGTTKNTARHRQHRELEVSGSGIDWERANLKNTYCRSPIPLPQEGNKDNMENRTVTRQRSTNKSLDTTSSNYVTAQYGSIGTSSSTGVDTGVDTGNSSTGGDTGNSSTHRGTGNSSTGGDTGGDTGNSSTGGDTGNSSTHRGTGNSSTGGDTGNSSTHRGTGNSSTGGDTGNSSTHRGTGNSSTGGDTGNSSTHRGTGNSSTGGDTGNSSTHRGTGNSSTGGDTGNSSTDGDSRGGTHNWPFEEEPLLHQEQSEEQ